MRFFGSTTVLLALGASAVAGHFIQSTHDHGHHQPAISYSVVDMHDEQHVSPYHHGGEIHEVHDAYHHESLHHEEHDHHHDDKDDKNSKYDFKYGVNDPKSGDVKEQWESRDGDKVTGGYTLKETDGTTRVVHYTADNKKGFEAIVHKIGEPKEEHKEHQHQEYHGEVGHSHHNLGWSH